MPKLPEISDLELQALIRNFASEVRVSGGTIFGKGRDGSLFTVHQHARKPVWPEKLGEILREIGISRDDFWTWWNNQ